MSDTVDSDVIHNGVNVYVIRLLNASDGTGESGVTKVDKSTLVASDGSAPASLDIWQARWSIQGFAFVTLLWDHTTDDEACYLTGNGYEDYTQLINERHVRTTPGLADPRTTGGTGDLLLTAPASATTGSYDITLWLFKNPV